MNIFLRGLKYKIVIDRYATILLILLHMNIYKFNNSKLIIKNNFCKKNKSI